MNTSKASASNSWWTAWKIFWLQVIILGAYYVHLKYNEEVANTAVETSTASALATCLEPTGASLLGAYGNGIKNISDNLVVSTGAPVDDIIVDNKATSPFGTFVDSNNNISRGLFFQGLFLLYGFNNEEARRNLLESIAADPQCLMCLWGLAASYGPNLNSFLTPENVVAGGNAVCHAEYLFAQIDSAKQYDSKKRDLQGPGSHVRVLFQALKARYGVQRCEGTVVNASLPFNEVEFNTAYARALAEVAKQFPVNYDVVTLAVEAALQLTTWDYYQPPTPGMLRRTLIPESLNDVEPPLKDALVEPVKLLHKVLGNAPYHPLALHLYIHITEQSSAPHLGWPAADKLFFVAEYLGSNHLKHMPAHTYARIGRFQDAIEASRRAIDLHRIYESHCLALYAGLHDIALLVMSAMYAGSSRLALHHAQASALGTFAALPSTVDDAMLENGVERATSNIFVSKYVTALFPAPRDLVLCRFGRWKVILAMHSKTAFPPTVDISSGNSHLRELKDSKESFNGIVDSLSAAAPYFVVIHLYAQTLALLQQKDIARVPLRLELLDTFATRTLAVTPIFERSHVFYGYHHDMALMMNQTVTAAYILSRNDPQGAPKDPAWIKYQMQAIQLLRDAAAMQDAFSYMEPENFYLPLNQCVGAVMLDTAQILMKSMQVTEVTDEQCEEQLSSIFAWLLESSRLFSDDLHLGHHPNNGWSLQGLLRVLIFTKKLETGSNHQQELRSSCIEHPKFRERLESFLVTVVQRVNDLEKIFEVTHSSHQGSNNGMSSNSVLTLQDAINAIRGQFRAAWRLADTRIRGPCCELGYC